MGVNLPWQGCTYCKGEVWGTAATHAIAEATSGGERHDWLGFFGGREGLMASAAPHLHVLAF